VAVPTLEKPRRRSLRFASFDQVLADVERIRGGKYVQLGNWAPGKALAHLASAMDASIDGVPFPAPWHVRVFGRLVVRYVVLYWKFPPGAKLPREAAQVMVPRDEVDFEAGVQALRRGIERLAVETKRWSHPVLGPMSIAQWNMLHLRHAELHLSFFVPTAD
jgi:hypothetical protein